MAAFMAYRGTKNVSNARKNAVTKTINPEVVLKAAQVARSGWGWCIDPADGKVYPYEPTPEEHYEFGRGPPFNPIESDADAWAIMYALLELGWRFRYENGGSLGPVFWAEHPHTTLKIWTGELNKLMLCAVSAQFSIPLYLEN